MKLKILALLASIIFSVPVIGMQMPAGENQKKWYKDAKEKGVSTPVLINIINQTQEYALIGYKKGEAGSDDYQYDLIKPNNTFKISFAIPDDKFIFPALIVYMRNNNIGIMEFSPFGDAKFKAIISSSVLTDEDKENLSALDQQGANLDPAKKTWFIDNSGNLKINKPLLDNLALTVIRNGIFKGRKYINSVDIKEGDTIVVSTDGTLAVNPPTSAENALQEYVNKVD